MLKVTYTFIMEGTLDRESEGYLDRMLESIIPEHDKENIILEWSITDLEELDEDSTVMG